MIRWVLLISMMLCGVLDVKAEAREHPFLIVKKEQFTELRRQAECLPWKGLMKEGAIVAADGFVNNPPDTYATTDRMKEVMSTIPLAYILNPDKRTEYVRVLCDAIDDWNDLLAQKSSGHNYVVPAGSAFFYSMLALDIMHDDLAEEQLARAEAMLDRVGRWFRETRQGWMTNRYGCAALWALYFDRRDDIEWAKRHYKEELKTYLTDSGVFFLSFGYAKSRANGTRVAKIYTMDVLEFTGEDTYYSDPQIVSLYEWLYGGSVTPFGSNVTVGDTNPVGGMWVGPRNFNAHKFSPLAARYSSWIISTVNARVMPDILYYVLMDQPLPEPEGPKSRIWPDSYAAFWEENVTPESLMAGFWAGSPVGVDTRGHCHRDANGLHLCAYGENVLRNVGYAGWGNAVGRFDWQYIQEEAKANNVVLVDGVNHADEHGGGMDEGFTSSLLDYACGNSGPALTNATHLRNLCMVHAQDDLPGYFVLFDEVHGHADTKEANVALHPNSAEVEVVAPNQEYRWTIRKRQDKDTFLSVFLGTEPRTATLEDGGLAAYRGNSFIGKYLYSTYALDAANSRNIVTVLFPHGDGMEKPSGGRVDSGGSSGWTLEFSNGTKDTAGESDGKKNIETGKSTWRGLACLYRQGADGIIFYFVRKGNLFASKDAPTGFSSDKPVSIHMRGGEGSIVSPGTEVTFRCPGLKGVLLDGEEVKVVKAAENEVTIMVPKGTFSVKLEE